MKKPLLSEHLLNNIFFDTCVYHQPGIDLLTKVIPVKNILFASEMIGAVRGIDPDDGPLLRRHEALHRRVDHRSMRSSASRSTKATRAASSARLDASSSSSERTYEMEHAS